MIKLLRHGEASELHGRASQSAWITGYPEVIGTDPLVPIWITVAVGTTIADRPPRRSVQARLRIRLLPRMTGGEACIRVRMQRAGLGNPPVQDWGETSPSHLCALAATDEDAPPQPANATLEDAQLSRVPRNGMVLVVAQHNLAKPCTDRGRAMMLPALKLSLDL